jgi:hypothetical protein
LPDVVDGVWVNWVGVGVCDQIRESIMILLTMGLNSDHFSDQPFKTQNEFQNDQISLSKS